MQRSKSFKCTGRTKGKNEGKGVCVGHEWALGKPMPKEARVKQYCHFTSADGDWDQNQLSPLGGFCEIP